MTATYQLTLPAGLELAEEVTLPNGRRVRGSAARVYDLLRQVSERRLVLPVGSEFAPAGWVPGFYLTMPQVGGGEGTRRLRGLREEHAVEIDKAPHQSKDGSTTNSYLYRLASASAAPVQTPAPQGGRLAEGLTVYPLRGSAGEAGGLAFELGARAIVHVSQHPDLRPSPALLEHVRAGQWSASELDEAYRQELLGAYRAGTFGRLITSWRPVVVLWDEPAAWSGLPALVRALDAVGAVVREMVQEGV